MLCRGSVDVTKVIAQQLQCLTALSRGRSEDTQQIALMVLVRSADSVDKREHEAVQQFLVQCVARDAIRGHGGAGLVASWLASKRALQTLEAPGTEGVARPSLGFLQVILDDPANASLADAQIREPRLGPQPPVRFAWLQRGERAR